MASAMFTVHGEGERARGEGERARGEAECAMRAEAANELRQNVRVHYNAAKSRTPSSGPSPFSGLWGEKHSYSNYRSPYIAVLVRAQLSGRAGETLIFRVVDEVMGFGGGGG